MKEWKNNKELWVWVGIVAFVGLAILLIPTVDDFLSGRRHDREHEKLNGNPPTPSTGDKDKEETTSYTTLICTIPASDLDQRTTSYEFTVTFATNGALKKSEVKRTIHYNDQADYEKEKIAASSEPMVGTGFVQTKTFDDTNVVSSLHVTYDHSLFDASKNTSGLTFPSTSLKNRTEIEAYVSTHNYSCSKTK